MSISLSVQKKGANDSDQYPVYTSGVFNRIIEPAAKSLGLEEVSLLGFLIIAEHNRTKLVDELDFLLHWIEKIAPENERQHLLLRTSRLQSLIRYIDLDEYEVSIG